jgi:hypothetical protein
MHDDHFYIGSHHGLTIFHLSLCLIYLAPFIDVPPPTKRQDIFFTDAMSYVQKTGRIYYYSGKVNTLSSISTLNSMVFILMDACT